MRMRMGECRWKRVCFAAEEKESGQVACRPLAPANPDQTGWRIDGAAGRFLTSH